MSKFNLEAALRRYDLEKRISDERVSRKKRMQRLIDAERNRRDRVARGVEYMSKTYDANAQLAVLLDMVRLGEVRLRRLPVNQVIETGAQTFWPLTDDNLTDWFQTGWDHYWFDLPHNSVKSAVEMFKRLGVAW